jgi:hypothetical protein
MKISVNVSIISGRKHISIGCIVRCAVLLYQVFGFTCMVGAEYRKARSMALHKALQKISGRCLNATTDQVRLTSSVDVHGEYRMKT